jgi:hypothetical protein
MHSVTSATSATAVSCDNALREPLALLEGRFAEGSVEVPGGRVSYRSCGSGPVVVLLHGISSGAASWLQCALKLESQARVIAWNAPGYGRSTPLTISQPKAVDYARRLQDMLQALEVEQCVLVGHSLGGYLSLMAALRLPQLVKGVVQSRQKRHESGCFATGILVDEVLAQAGGGVKTRERECLERRCMSSNFD